MVKLAVVPVIPLALSEAMKAATFAISSTVMTRACEVPRELFPGYSRCRGLNVEDLFHRASLWDAVWSQTDHANACCCAMVRTLLRSPRGDAAGPPTFLRSTTER